MIDDGIYRFEGAVLSQPPIAIDLLIVIARQSVPPDVLSDRYRDPTAGARLPHRGINHV
jgi:hypothetical protein